MTTPLRIRIVADDWWTGYDAGYAGKKYVQVYQQFAGLDRYSWLSGFIEGEGDREMRREPRQREERKEKPCQQNSDSTP